MNVSTFPQDELTAPLTSFADWLLSYEPSPYEAPNQVVDFNSAVGNDRFLFPFEAVGKWYLYDASIGLFIIAGVIIILSIITCINTGYFRGAQCLTRKNKETKLWPRKTKLIALALMVACCLVALLAMVSSLVFSTRLSQHTLGDVANSYELSLEIVSAAGRTVDNTQVLLEDVMQTNLDQIDACADAYNLNIQAGRALDIAMFQSQLIQDTVDRLEYIYNRMGGYASGAMLAMQWTIRIAILALSPIWILTLMFAIIIMVRSSLSTVSDVEEAREVRANRSCAERWCALSTLDSVVFINGLLAACLFMLTVVFSDYCVDPDTRLMNALSVQLDYNMTLVPDVETGTCTPFLLYDDGSTGAELSEIPSFYSSGLREMCHVITCNPDVHERSPIAALIQFEAQVDGLREQLIVASAELEDGNIGDLADANNRSSCIQILNNAEQKLETTRALRVAARLANCRTLNQIYARTAYDKVCENVPVNLYKLFLCLFIPVVFIYFANLLTEIFLLDEPTVDFSYQDKKVMVAGEASKSDPYHPEEEGIEINISPSNNDAESSSGSVYSDSRPPSPRPVSTNSGEYMDGGNDSEESSNEDLALEDSPAVSPVVAVRASGHCFMGAEDPSVVDVVDVEIGKETAVVSSGHFDVAALDDGEESDSDHTIMRDDYDDDDDRLDDHAFVARMSVD